MLDDPSVRNEERHRRSRMKLVLLKGLLAFLDTVTPAECLTVGNMNPPDLHCFACTLQAIREKVAKAVKFWEENDRFKSALS